MRRKVEFPGKKNKKIWDQKLVINNLESKFCTYLTPFRRVSIIARGHNQYLGDGKADGTSGVKLCRNNYMSDEKFVEDSRKKY